jgi:hypothetical protein
MSDLLASGLAWHAAQLKSFASRAVTYSRGSQSLSVQATVGRSDYDVASGDAGFQRVVTRDYLIALADLASLAGGGEPKRGDRIIETIAGVARTFEVAAPGDGVQCFAFSDTDGNVVRVHTKRVA